MPLIHSITVWPWCNSVSLQNKLGRITEAFALPFQQNLPWPLYQIFLLKTELLQLAMTQLFLDSKLTKDKYSSHRLVLRLVSVVCYMTRLSSLPWEGSRWSSLEVSLGKGLLETFLPLISVQQNVFYFHLFWEQEQSWYIDVTSKYLQRPSINCTAGGSFLKSSQENHLPDQLPSTSLLYPVAFFFFFVWMKEI